MQDVLGKRVNEPSKSCFVMYSVGFAHWQNPVCSVAECVESQNNGVRSSEFIRLNGLMPMLFSRVAVSRHFTNPKLSAENLASRWYKPGMRVDSLARSSRRWRLGVSIEIVTSRNKRRDEQRTVPRGNVSGGRKLIGDSARRIDNPPRVNNLPHVLSTT